MDKEECLLWSKGERGEGGKIYNMMLSSSSSTRKKKNNSPLSSILCCCPLLFKVTQNKSKLFRPFNFYSLLPFSTLFLQEKYYKKKNPFLSFSFIKKNHINMGANLSKALSKMFGSKEMRILMLGLDAAGKTSK